MFPWQLQSWSNFSLRISIGTQYFFNYFLKYFLKSELQIFHRQLQSWSELSLRISIGRRHRQDKATAKVKLLNFSFSPQSGFEVKVNQGEELTQIYIYGAAGLKGWRIESESEICWKTRIHIFREWRDIRPQGFNPRFLRRRESSGDFVKSPACPCKV